MMIQTVPRLRTVISPPFSRDVTASAPSSIRATTIRIRLIRRIKTAMAQNYLGLGRETRMANAG
jgi:hypothetical protein